MPITVVSTRGINDQKVIRRTGVVHNDETIINVNPTDIVSVTAELTAGPGSVLILATNAKDSGRTDFTGMADAGGGAKTASFASVSIGKGWTAVGVDINASSGGTWTITYRVVPDRA
jgi:hypothetical protein